MVSAPDFSPLSLNTRAISAFQEIHVIAIIGAGPVGSHLAYHLAKRGEEVEVFEEHNTVGEPIQCTGIVTSGISEFAPSTKYVVNRIKDTRIVAPNGEGVEIRMSHDNIVMCRTKFDRYLADRAKKAGAQYHLGHRYVKHSGKNVVFKVGREWRRRKNITADVVVGADGPDSAVAKSAGLYGERKFFLSAQATVQLENNNVVEFYTGFGDFAWLVPESKTLVRIGLCTRANVFRTFDTFMKWRLGPQYKENIVARQGGLIPLYDPRARTHAGNAYLVGDAALMVKATTAGGIIQGLIAAEELAKVLIEGGNYEHAWRKRIGKDLFLHLFMRNLMDRFSEKDYNEIIHIFKQEKNRRVLEEFDRDYPTRYLLRLVLQEPRFLTFARVLLRRRKVR